MKYPLAVPGHLAGRALVPYRHRPVPVPPRSLTEEFVRGSITTGILAALQGRQASLDRRTLRLAVQGGVALAAGTAAVQAAREARHGQMLLAIAAGATAVAAAEHLLKEEPISKELPHGQKT
ncbi:MAG: hypothetical protein Q4D91_12830 [Lautropia sp.]|nr:hypothetical protein [Lautropia sp.]